MMHKDLTKHQNLRYCNTNMLWYHCDTNDSLSYGYSAHKAHKSNKRSRRGYNHTPDGDRLILISQTVDSSYSSVCFLAVLSCSCGNTLNSSHQPLPSFCCSCLGHSSRVRPSAAAGLPCCRFTTWPVCFHQQAQRHCSCDSQSLC